MGKYIRAWDIPNIDAVKPAKRAFTPSYIVSVYKWWCNLLPFKFCTSLKEYFCTVFNSAHILMIWIFQLAFWFWPPRTDWWLCCRIDHSCQLIQSTVWMNYLSIHNAAWNTVSSSHIMESILYETTECKTPTPSTLNQLHHNDETLPLHKPKKPSSFKTS